MSKQPKPAKIGQKGDFLTEATALSSIFKLWEKLKVFLLPNMPRYLVELIRDNLDFKTLNTICQDCWVH